MPIKRTSPIKRITQEDEIRGVLTGLKTLKVGLEREFKQSTEARTEKELQGINARINRQFTNLERQIVQNYNGLFQNIQKSVMEKLNSINQPADGNPGRDGKDGKDGKPGKDGKNADRKQIVADVLARIKQPESPDTDAIIKALLEELKKQITIDNIPGLRTELRSISSKVMLGGGGISAPLKFSFSGDGSTTDFTLPAEPSGEGAAIWAYYNSGWLQPDTHFTVTGTAFSTTFTAEDGTTIEGFLMP